MKPGECVTAATIREVREEAGLTVSGFVAVNLSSGGIRRGNRYTSCSCFGPASSLASCVPPVRARWNG